MRGGFHIKSDASPVLEAIRVTCHPLGSLDEAERQLAVALNAGDSCAWGCVKMDGPDDASSHLSFPLLLPINTPLLQIHFFTFSEASLDSLLSLLLATANYRSCIRRVRLPSSSPSSTDSSTSSSSPSKSKRPPFTCK